MMHLQKLKKMGKRKHSKISKEKKKKNIHQREEKSAPGVVMSSLPDGASLQISTKKKKMSHASSTSPKNDQIGLEMIEKWQQILSLQDTLTLILGYIPEYLLERTMRFVNRDFYLASSVAWRENIRSLKIHASSLKEIEIGIKRWEKLKNLKDVKISFTDFDICYEFDVCCLSHLGFEKIGVVNTTSIFSKSLVDTKWVETLRYLQIDIHQQYFTALFDLNLHTLVVQFLELDDSELIIGKDDKPLFKSLTHLDYSSIAFNNMDEFLNRLVNLNKLRNGDDDMSIENVKLPNLKHYNCMHELMGIEEVFPKLESLKSYSSFSTANVTGAISLKTLKSVTLSLESKTISSIPDALFNLPLLEKLSLLVYCSSLTKCSKINPKPLDNLKKVKLVFFEYENGELPISFFHFRKCSNIEKIRFEEESQKVLVDMNDFSNFPLLKSLAVTAGSASNWNSPICTLESLAINVKKQCSVTLTGLDKLKRLEYVSQNMNSLVQYLNDNSNDCIRDLNISGKDISKFTSFPCYLETLTITNMYLKEINERFVNIVNNQTNLRKLVIEESKFDLVPLLESLTCLIHQISKIQLSGECYPIPYSESKYITNLIKVLSIYDSKKIDLKLSGFNYTFSNQSTGYLISQIKSRFTTISFTS